MLTNKDFLYYLLELGFKERNGTVDEFLNGSSRLELEMISPEKTSSLNLIFTQISNYYCNILFGYIPADYKTSTLDGQDDGIDYQGHANCETAVVASMAVIEDMLNGVGSNLSLLRF